MRSFLTIICLVCCMSCSTPEYGIFEAAPAHDAPLRSKTIVLIHGMFATARGWDAWIKFFEAKGYKVYAPAWPLHEATVAEQKARHPSRALGRLELSQVVESYRSFLKTLPETPILVGHSMGGLIVQILLQEGRGSAGVAIDSAPPKGVLSFRFSFLRANWPVLSPFADENEPFAMDDDQFRYAMANCLSEDVARRFFQESAVPESRLVGKGPLSATAKIDPTLKKVPLLFVAGGEDHIIPPSLNYSNFKDYSDSASLTEFKLFEGRCHWTLNQDDWQSVADYIAGWLVKISKS